MSHLCCADTTTLKWTQYVDMWQILKHTHGTCVTCLVHDTTPL